VFKSLGRSYQIFTESLYILRKDKEILIFPVLSGIFTILALGALIFGGTVTGFFSRLIDEGQTPSGKSQLLGYAFLFVWYFVSWFIVLFFNVAVIQCAKIRLEGGDPVTADGFGAAKKHLGRIALWAMVSATVGLVLQAIADKNKALGGIVKGLLGAAWSIATFFIVPVMIFEQRSLMDSFRQSTRLLGKTWGESAVGAAGIGLFVTLIALPALALPAVLGAVGGTTWALVGVGLMLLYWLILAIISSALSGIYRAGLYVYATTGQIPSSMNQELVKAAFVVR
jgi:uncharacterized protein DUF6159